MDRFKIWHFSKGIITTCRINFHLRAILDFVKYANIKAYMAVRLAKCNAQNVYKI